MNTCPAWCTRSHTTPVPVPTHDRVIAEQRTDSGDSITVRVVWQEHPGAAQERAPVRVVVDTTTPGYRTLLELSREQADTLSDCLSLARGPRWLWVALARGAGFVKGWELPPATRPASPRWVPPARPPCPSWCKLRNCSRWSHYGDVAEWEDVQRLTEVAVQQQHGQRPEVVICTETWNDQGDTTHREPVVMSPVVALATGLMLRRGRLSAALLSAAASAGVAGQQEAVNR